jgi:hypothetical protein
MIDINDGDKVRIINFIKENDLDLTPVDGGIIRFHIKSLDNMIFYFYTYDSKYILVKYDPSKDKGNPGSQSYEYYYYDTLSQVLEAIKFYDDSLYKKWWQETTNSAEIGFDKNSYKDDWFLEFKGDNNWKVEDSDCYKYLTFNDPSYKPKLKSPFNTLHEVSPINSEPQYCEVNSLNFEIHPISCLDGAESYLLKLLINNEEIFKEYVNYIVTKKKGLKLLLGEIFKSMEQFIR